MEVLDMRAEPRGMGQVYVVKGPRSQIGGEGGSPNEKGLPSSQDLHSDALRASSSLKMSLWAHRAVAHLLGSRGKVTISGSIGAAAPSASCSCR